MAALVGIRACLSGKLQNVFFFLLSRDIDIVFKLRVFCVCNLSFIRSYVNVSVGGGRMLGRSVSKVKFLSLCLMYHRDTATQMTVTPQVVHAYITENLSCVKIRLLGNGLGLFQSRAIFGSYAKRLII